MEKPKFTKVFKRHGLTIILFAFLAGYFTFQWTTGQCPLRLAAQKFSDGGSASSVPPSENGFNLYSSNLDFELIDGRILPVADLKGKPTVVNYWATWCGPCRKELPGFNAVARDFGGKAQFVAISLDDRVDQVKQFLSRQPIGFAVSHGDTRLMRHTGRVTGIPTTLFFDAEGRYRGKHVGYLSEGGLRQKLKSL